jgi:hypothetical protein
MSAEQDLLTKWRSLPPNRQEEVLDFVEFLHVKNSVDKSSLGERLRQIRAEIVASGEPLLTRDEVEQEIGSRRGGLSQE